MLMRGLAAGDGLGVGVGVAPELAVGLPLGSGEESTSGLGSMNEVGLGEGGGYTITS